MPGLCAASGIQQCPCLSYREGSFLDFNIKVYIHYSTAQTEGGLCLVLELHTPQSNCCESSPPRPVLLVYVREKEIKSGTAQCRNATETSG